MSTPERPEPTIHWQFSHFEGLDGRTVHDWLRLRQDIFVVEQHCIFPEIDGRDPEAWHLLGWSAALGSTARQLVLGARIFVPQEPGGDLSIGRVVCQSSWRGQGLGRHLMLRAIAHAESRSPRSPILLHAQCDLEEFYRSLGFQTISAPYLWDGIDHIDMRREAP